MNVQVTIKIDRESIAEMAEVFKAIIGGGIVPPVPGQGIRQAQQPVPGAAPTTQQTPVTPSVPVAQSQTPQAVQPAQERQTYSGQIAQRTQLPPEAVTGSAVQAQTAAPVSSPSYTLEDLASAAMPLMERGMMAQLQELLAGYGVEDLPSLPAEHYGNFATALRGMGAQI